MVPGAPEGSLFAARCTPGAPMRRSLVRSRPAKYTIYIFCEHLAFQKTSRWSLMWLNPEVRCFLCIQPQTQKRKAVAWE